MKRTIYAVFALLMFAACKQQQPLPEPVIDSIEVDDDSYVLDYKAQTINLNFATNAEYQFEIGADWIVHVDEESILPLRRIVRRMNVAPISRLLLAMLSIWLLSFKAHAPNYSTYP